MQQPRSPRARRRALSPLEGQDADIKTEGSLRHHQRERKRSVDRRPLEVRHARRGAGPAEAAEAAVGRPGLIHFF